MYQSILSILVQLLLMILPNRLWCSLVYLNLLRSPGRGESRFVTSVGYRIGSSGALALVLGQLQ